MTITYCYRMVNDPGPFGGDPQLRRVYYRNGEPIGFEDYPPIFSAPAGETEEYAVSDLEEAIGDLRNHPAPIERSPLWTNRKEDYAFLPGINIDKALCLEDDEEKTA